ncbi:MAG: hypothetical protein ABIN69_13200, partial [Aestuariivirga sp.]
QPRLASLLPFSPIARPLRHKLFDPVNHASLGPTPCRGMNAENQSQRRLPGKNVAKKAEGEEVLHHH